MYVEGLLSSLTRVKKARSLRASIISVMKHPQLPTGINLSRISRSVSYQSSSESQCSKLKVAGSSLMKQHKRHKRNRR